MKLILLNLYLLISIIRFALDWINRYLVDVRPAFIVDAHEEALFINQYGERLSPDALSARVTAYVDAANHLRHLMTRFALAVRQRRTGRPGELDLAAIQGFMRSRLEGQLTLDELAGVANLSRYHFVSRYRALTGVPPIRHYLQMKMEAACRLLDEPERSVKAVSAALGYTDALYFSRAFKSVVGLSPRAYRASVRR